MYAVSAWCALGPWGPSELERRDKGMHLLAANPWHNADRRSMRSRLLLERVLQGHDGGLRLQVTGSTRSQDAKSSFHEGDGK